MLIKAREFASGFINNAVLYKKEKWDKSHKEPKFKIGNKVLTSTLNFNNIHEPRQLKDSYVGPFVTIKLHGQNAVKVALKGEFERKHPTFPVSLLKIWVEPKEKFPKRARGTSNSFR